MHGKDFEAADHIVLNYKKPNQERKKRRKAYQCVWIELHLRGAPSESVFPRNYATRPLECRHGIFADRHASRVTSGIRGSSPRIEPILGTRKVNLLRYNILCQKTRENHQNRAQKPLLTTSKVSFLSYNPTDLKKLISLHRKPSLTITMYGMYGMYDMYGGKG